MGDPEEAAGERGCRSLCTFLSPGQKRQIESLPIQPFDFRGFECLSAFFRGAEVISGELEENIRVKSVGPYLLAPFGPFGSEPKALSEEVERGVELSFEGTLLWRRTVRVTDVVVDLVTNICIFL